MAGNAGKNVGAGAFIHRQADFRGLHLDRAGNGEREGCAAELGRIDAEKKVVHDRIADKDAVQNVGAGNAALGADLVDQAIQRFPDCERHRLASVRVHHHIGDAAHKIFAEADLRVGGAGRGDRAARQERGQMHGDRRRADIAGNAIGLVLEAWIKGNQAGGQAAAIMVDRGRHLPLALAQDLLDFRDQMEIDLDLVEMPVSGDRHFQPVEIAERLFHVGFLDLDITHADCRIAVEDALVGRLADDLGVDDRILRHVDDEIAKNLRRTGETASGGQAADAVIALFLRSYGRKMIVGRGDPVLGKIAFLHGDLTAPTGGATATDALDINAKLPGGFQNLCANRKPATLAGRHEEDEGISFGNIGHAGSAYSVRAPAPARAARPPRRPLEAAGAAVAATAPPSAGL